MCLHAEWLVQQHDTICADNYIYFRFKLQACVAVRSGSCICTAFFFIKVDSDSVDVLPRGVPPFRLFTQLGNGSHTIFGLCLPFERGMGMSMPWQFQSRVGVQRDVRVHGLTGCTIVTTAVVVSMRSASADCTDSATLVCSSGACVVMSCVYGSFTRYGAVPGVTG